MSPARNRNECSEHLLARHAIVPSDLSFLFLQKDLGLSDVFKRGEQKAEKLSCWRAKRNEGFGKGLKINSSFVRDTTAWRQDFFEFSHQLKSPWLPVLALETRLFRSIRLATDHVGSASMSVDDSFRLFFFFQQIFFCRFSTLNAFPRDRIVRQSIWTLIIENSFVYVCRMCVCVIYFNVSLTQWWDAKMYLEVAESIDQLSTSFFLSRQSSNFSNHDVDFSFDLRFFSPLKCDTLTITKILIAKGRRLEFPIARCLARKPGFHGRSLQIFIAASLNIYSSWKLSSSVCARCASLGRSISAWMFQVCAA